MATIAEQLKAHIVQGESKGYGKLSLNDIGARDLDSFECFSSYEGRHYWEFSDGSKVEVDDKDYLVSVC